ncbi:hypothetical protein BS614_23495 [Paenibacillus xylanexedens]|uniref:hypothetical protein n=1 Tax=Paenibacillus xylanexedens TaxID=528191 RepID=UPI0009386EAE|nr:hypothetical protein [Paenibacillus xylanexedens]APO46714.1 hypothetical protein BS614_23495 [Paenibacillus xylanexedens]
MKRVSFFLLFLLLLTASACSNKVTSYTGESENWRVSCTVQSNSDVASYEYEIRYLGDNPSLIEKINYKFMSENIHSKGEVHFNNVIRGKAEGMSPFLDENEFLVQIDWEGKSEKIIVTK